MKILIASNNAPSEHKKYAGIFVVNQLNFFKKNWPDIEFYQCFLQRKNTGKIGSLIKYISYFLNLRQKLKIKFEVVHFHFLFPNILLILLLKSRLRGSHVLMTLHGNDVTFSYKNTLFRYLTKKGLVYVDQILSVGTGIADEFENVYHRKVSSVIPAGIDRSIFFPKNEEKLYDFVFVGSFYKAKGLDMLLEAIELLGTKSGLYPSFCFIGSGTELCAIQAMSHPDKVTIIEDAEQSTIANYVRKSRYLVLPTRKEAFGLVITEAMYCGIPVITTPLVGPKMQVQDGSNGFLLEKINTESLVEQLVKAHFLSQEDYQQMSVRCIQSNTDYSLDRVCDKLMAIYTEMAGTNESL